MPETQYFTGIDIVDALTINPLTVEQDGVYTAPDGVLGYNPVTVKCNEPWAPLQDGYSNFWFELTDDTLSPWLNFSAKNAGATIDWGDGSGEQALDMLTPTHTYSKAGRYVVKCKGVTGIARQHSTPYTNATAYYNTVLKNVELNSDITTLGNFSFWNCTGLKNIVGGNISSLNNGCFSYCSSLEQIDLNFASAFTAWNGSASSCFSLTQATFPQTTQSIIANCFSFCLSLQTITIPTSIQDIGNSAFGSCYSLSEIHIQAQTPPTLGTTPFNNIASNFVIYVPVGYGDTYKSASGWSDCADHILEEGQTPTRAMVAKFNSTDNDDGEKR